MGISAANEILIFGDIGEDFWAEDGGITAKGVLSQLSNFSADSDVTVRINSPGGDAFEGVAIYNVLASAPQRVIVRVDGTAISAASIIAMAGDEIHMAENALLMIHDPWTFAMGNAADMRQTADVLDVVAGALAQTYVSKTGKTLADVRSLMAAETWYTAAEALAEGFATHVDAKAHNVAAKLTTAHMKAYKRAPAAASAWLAERGRSRGAEMRVAAAVRNEREYNRGVAKPDSPYDVPVNGSAFTINLPEASHAGTRVYTFTAPEEPGPFMVSLAEDGDAVIVTRPQDHPSATERGGDNPHIGDTVDPKEVQAALDTAKAELTEAKAQAKALDIQNAALVAERDSAVSKLQAVEDAATEEHVRGLVGVKFAKCEFADQLELAKSNRPLFDKLIAQRGDMTILQRDPSNRGADPKVKPLDAVNDDGRSAANLINEAAAAVV